MSMFSKISVGEKEFIFDAHKILNVEYMALEDVTGFTAVEWETKLQRGSMRAATALWWLMMKRHEDPQIEFDSIEFEIDKLSITLQDDVDDEVKKEESESVTPTPESESVTRTTDTLSVS